MCRLGCKLRFHRHTAECDSTAQLDEWSLHTPPDEKCPELFTNQDDHPNQRSFIGYCVDGENAHSGELYVFKLCVGKFHILFFWPKNQQYGTISPGLINAVSKLTYIGVLPTHKTFHLSSFGHRPVDLPEGKTGHFTVHSSTFIKQWAFIRYLG